MSRLLIEVLLYKLFLIKKIDCLYDNKINNTWPIQRRVEPTILHLKQYFCIPLPKLLRLNPNNNTKPNIKVDRATDLAYFVERILERESESRGFSFKDAEKVGSSIRIGSFYRSS